MDGRRRAWLGLCCGLTFALIVLGGIVRLSRAGLSITEWNPVTGFLPPFGDGAWQEAFDKYRATPEFAQFNSTMEQFRQIYLLEYAHRLLARVTGLALVLPLAYWLVRRRMSLREARPILAVLAVGVLQAGLGWMMVKSGLVDVPHVSPYRLAAHLVLGMALFASLVWMLSPSRAPVSPLGALVLGIAVVTVAWGGLMAGTHAGHVFPTFPKMGDAWIPVCDTEAATIHFVHRLAALLLAASCVALAWQSRARLLAWLTVGVVALQIALGALVVLHHVPIVLASAHQANAVLLVGLLTLLVRVDMRHRPAPTLGRACLDASVGDRG